jgi:hypothetical protein
MTDARGPFRHAPNEPMDLQAEMQARTSQGGDRYLFGFGGGKKWLLFLDRRKTAAEGEECWRLYSQNLAPKVAPQQPALTGPREARGSAGWLLLRLPPLSMLRPACRG